MRRAAPLIAVYLFDLGVFGTEMLTAGYQLSAPSLSAGLQRAPWHQMYAAINAADDS